MGSQRRKSRKRKRYGPAVLLLALLALGGWGAWCFLAPYGPQAEVFVEIQPGSSVLRIGQQLESAGVVRNQFVFDVLRWIRRGRLLAGEYRFDHPAAVTEVYDRIARGDVYTKAVMVPEGATVFDIAERLEQAGFGPKESFLEAQARDTSLVADLDPEARSLEGYLFPDTYRFPRKATADHICETMVRRFRQKAALAGLKEHVHDVVTMASLVEKETAVGAERPLVASVFANRLAHHMPLMTDPSVIYGLELEGQWRGAIYQSDLKRDTPYNTYLHAGLPPGPIANPGLRSLQAAMHPAKTDYLYFVAAGDDPQGHSVFSATLEQHAHDVAAYRSAMRKAGAR